MVIMYELDLNLHVIDRQVYSVLDWMGDIGGLLEAMLYLGMFLVSFFKYGQLQAMLAQHLFVTENREKKQEPLPQVSSFRLMMLSACKKLCKCCSCCCILRVNRSDRIK